MTIPYKSHPAPNLVCSGLPSSSADFELLAQDGVKLVINLRPDSEDPGRSLKDEVLQAGMQYIQIPISPQRADFNRENAALLRDAIASASGDVLVFCGSSNRVGGLLALKSFLFDEMTREEAIAFGEAAGMTHIKPMIVSVLDELEG